MRPRESRDAAKVRRHNARTRLNHVLGYGDILRQDAAESGREELAELFARIGESAMNLREPLALRLGEDTPREDTPREDTPGADTPGADTPGADTPGADTPGADTPREDTPREDTPGEDHLDRLIYDLLFSIISLIQEAKGMATAIGDRSLADDVDKLLEAANGILELMAAEDDGEDEVQVEGKAAFGEATFGEAASGGAPRVVMPSILSPRDAPSPGAHPGRILIVDDNLFNRELLSRHLERQGHEVRSAMDGATALEALEAESFDVAIIDVMMPGMNGYQLLERLRATDRLPGLYVIVISALEDTQSIARCIQLGAEDYLPREFEPVILKARIESCLEKKRLKEEQELYVAALVESQERLRSELRGGAAYVRSLLPARLAEEEIATDWMFIPSASLGGDVFGYHRLGGAYEPGAEAAGLPGGEGAAALLALYLIDVSGHGIEAALCSVSIMNMLRARSVPGTESGEPSMVLARLGASFKMEEQNNLYFTAWYGIWDPATRELGYASAGSPPAILILPGGGAFQLETGGMIIGVDPGASYRSGSAIVPHGSRLFLFSDGAYEFRAKDGSILGLEPFIGVLASRAAATPAGVSALDGLLSDLQSLSRKTRFSDDVSLLEFRFD